MHGQLEKEKEKLDQLLDRKKETDSQFKSLGSFGPLDTHESVGESTGRTLSKVNSC